MTAREQLPTDAEWIASGDADRNGYECWLEWLRYKREQLAKRQPTEGEVA